MKSKDFGHIALAVIILCFIFMLWVTYNPEPYVTTIIKLENIFPCEKLDNEWVKVTSFSVEKSFYVCTRVSSNVPDLEGQLTLRVFEGEREPWEYEIFNDIVDITNGDMAIRINEYLYPGEYEVTLGDGKKTLGTVQIVVTDQ